ncbi:hypothetical protein TH63_18680 [Rufibacter radiotolerans]|uniref:SH3 domain-containing protein n=2 Tax=Rufibacter radiotolerans TaxID=1379910 RepID=A0A0H4VPI0_9BACT|nr:hypothetical protein TH63_18680 [Rufibacter radiotolerans]
MAVMAQGPTSRVNADKVKMYRQPDPKGEVMRLLNPEDEIIVMREQNRQWTLVQIDGEGGYVLTSYLKAKKGKKVTAAKLSQDGTKSARL